MGKVRRKKTKEQLIHIFEGLIKSLLSTISWMIIG